MSDHNRTQKERSAIYGDYDGGCRTREIILGALTARYTKVNGTRMPKRYTQYLWDIVNKLSRLAVTPDHLDSWHDISIYAKLAEQAIKENKNANK